HDAVDGARRLGDARDAGERAVDAVDQQRDAEPGETGGEMAIDRSEKGEQRHGAAAGREQMDGKARHPSRATGSALAPDAQFRLQSPARLRLSALWTLKSTRAKG